MKSVFNRDKVDFTKEPMFFGAQQNTQRYDVYKYPVFDKLTQTQLGYFWRPEEVSLQKDRADYQQFRPEQKFIFTANLKYQTLLDSVQGRGVLTAFGPYCSLPELESCMNAWQFFENISMGPVETSSHTPPCFSLPLAFNSFTNVSLKSCSPAKFGGKAP